MIIKMPMPEFSDKVLLEKINEIINMVNYLHEEINKIKASLGL